MRLWPLRRPAPSHEIMLDDDALDRAIRAGVQFPLEWFLQQSPEIQEVIAKRRDRWLEDLVVAAGYAILDPERTQLGLAAEDGDEDAEAALVGLNARAVAEVMGRHAAREGAGELRRPTPLVMGGLGERRRVSTEEREAGRRKGSLAVFGAEEKAG